ncbi:MAG: fluoride efflux transporter CrcB [Balneolaceae bacterium]|nr:fluoride efflux transporter CrcB [Balneolaceae bacterium]
MTELLAVATGGALGAFVRFALSTLCNRLFQNPKVLTGTLVSNIIGCFLGGIALGWITADGFIETRIALFITTGFLGSLTTFSTFALETYGMLNRDTLKPLAAYLFLQIVAAFFVTVSGFWLYQMLGGYG